jgi:two-component system sensor histidine kinase PilS (NtrC family)
VDTAARYSALFIDPQPTAESFWTSLRYFNLYRVAVAALFLGLTVVYDDALNLGAHQLAFFRFVAAAYLFAAIALHAVLRNLHRYFNEQLTLHVGIDVLAISLLMYASGGIRSGLGVMILISLTGAAVVAPP